MAILFAFCCGQLLGSKLGDPKARFQIILWSIGLVVVTLAILFALWYVGKFDLPLLGTRDVSRAGRFELEPPDTSICMASQGAAVVARKCSKDDGDAGEQQFSYESKEGVLKNASNKCVVVVEGAAGGELALEACGDASKGWTMRDNTLCWKERHRKGCIGLKMSYDIALRYSSFHEIAEDASRIKVHHHR